MKEIFKKIDKVFVGCESVIVCIGVLVATGVTFCNVIMRYFFHSPLMWAEELTRYIFIWVTFIGGSLCIRNNVHVKMNLLQVKLPAKAARILGIIVYVLCIIGSLMIAWLGYKMVQNVAVLGQVSPSMPWFKTVYVNLPVFLYGILAVKGYLQLLVKSLQRKDVIVETIGGEET